MFSLLLLRLAAARGGQRRPEAARMPQWRMVFAPASRKDPEHDILAALEDWVERGRARST
jgi:hypothetical protein